MFSALVIVAGVSAQSGPECTRTSDFPGYSIDDYEWKDNAFRGRTMTILKCSTGKSRNGKKFVGLKCENGQIRLFNDDFCESDSSSMGFTPGIVTPTKPKKTCKIKYAKRAVTKKWVFKNNICRPGFAVDESLVDGSWFWVKCINGQLKTNVRDGPQRGQRATLDGNALCKKVTEDCEVTNGTTVGNRKWMFKGNVCQEGFIIDESQVRADRWNYVRCGRGSLKARTHAGWERLDKTQICKRDTSFCANVNIPGFAKTKKDLALGVTKCELCGARFEANGAVLPDGCNWIYCVGDEFYAKDSAGRKTDIDQGSAANLCREV